MGNIISLFFLNTLTYFVVFIGAPYWTGEELAELYPKPVYKCVFSLFMEIGHLAYRLVETIISGICDGLLSHSRLLSGLLTLGAYTAILYFASSAYESLMTNNLPILGNVVTDTSKYAALSDTLYAGQLWKSTIGLGIGTRLALTVKYLTVFSFCNLFYFGVLYGFLQYKVMGLNIITPVSSIVEAMDERIETLADKDLADNNPITSALYEIHIAALRLVQCPLGFISRFRIFNACLVGGAGVVLLVAILAYSIWSAVFAGAIADWGNFFSSAVDQMDLVNIVFSLLLTLVEMLIINIIGSMVYAIAPDAVKGGIDLMVGACAALDGRMREGRENFAATHDYSFQQSGDDGTTLHRMEF